MKRQTIVAVSPRPDEHGAVKSVLSSVVALGVCPPRLDRLSITPGFRARHAASVLAALILAVRAILSAQNYFSAQSLLPEQAQKPQGIPVYTIKIEAVESEQVKLPAEFRMALYENLIEEVRKTGKFLLVYRSGERVPEGGPDLVVLRTRVEGFKEGSQRKREVTTVAGATSIKVRAQVAARDGRLLVDRDVEGRVRFFGDNLRATFNLSKAIAKILRESL